MTKATTEGSARAGDVEIHYRVLGDGGETLVLVNGIGDDIDGWANQVDEFLAADLRLVTFDNRGVGASGQPPGPYTSLEMAEDLHAVVGELELSGFHLVGVSMGGVIAQEYALAHPSALASLVLANTYAIADPFTRAALESWATVAEAGGMALMMSQQAPWIFSPQFYSSQPARVEELVALAQTTTQPPEAFAAQMAALVGHDCSGRLGALGVPTLVLAAEDDIIIRPELSRELFELLPEPGRTWCSVPGAHAAFWENPHPWNGAVIEFVNAHRAH